MDESNQILLSRLKRAPSHTITLNDIAELAGVSYQTVSRVINQRPDVSADTRQRILNLIQELNYQPNKAARSLAAHHSRTLGLVAPSMSDFGPGKIMASAEDFTKAMNYDLVVSHITDSSSSALMHVLNSLNRWSLEGVLIFMPMASEIYVHLSKLQQSLPIVLIDAPPEIDIPSVVLEQRHAAEQLAHYLIDLGHRHICEITGPHNWYGALQRHRGIQDGLSARGLRPLHVLEGDWTARTGYHLTHQLLDQYEFTALVMGNDEMAIGAMRAIRERGLRVPDDISVTGFDDVPSAAYFEPPLTTLAQDFVELGKQGVELLIELISQPNSAPAPRILASKLVIRHSTAAPRNLY